MRERMPALLRAFTATVRLLMETNPRLTTAMLLGGIVEAAFYPLMVLVAAEILRVALNPDTLLSSGNLQMLGLLLAVLGIQQIVAAANETAVALLRAESVQVINERLMHKLRLIPYRLFEDSDFQATYGIAIREASYRPSFVVEGLLQFLTSAVAFVLILGALLAIAPAFALLFAAVVLLAAVDVRFHMRTLELQTGAAADLMRMSYLSHMLVDAGWQRDLRTYRSDVPLREYSSLGRAYVARLRRLVTRFQSARALSGFVVSALLVGAIALMFWLVDQRVLDQARIALLVPALLIGLTQARGVASAAGLLVDALGFADKLFAFLAAPFSEILPSAAGVARVRIDVIRLSGVTFRYPHATRNALDGVDVEFGRGTTAIVGPNAAGKSTLVKLLCGLLEPTAGSLSARDEAGNELAFDELRRAVLYQDPSHLYLSVRQNVTMRYDRIAGEEDRIREALQVAGLSSMVNALPHGIETVVGAGFGGAVDLSGGEWQRLALARLIFQDSPLILLDEPVASLDPEGERSIFELVSALGRTKFVILTTHRYRNIQQSDRIIVLVDGRIAETGTHEQLVALRQEYWALYMSQLRALA